jgi:hypothetical protein
MSQWPYPTGSAAKSIDTVDHDLRPDPDETVSEVPVCKFCKSRNLRNNGSYVSVRWNEKRQAVVCRDCGRGSYLPLGQWLERDPMVSPHGSSRPRRSRPKAICDCGSLNLRPRGWRAHGGGRQLVECVDCRKRFVLDAGVTISGARNSEPHFALPDASEEANALFIVAKSDHCDFEAMREVIGYTQNERECLQFLANQGVLAGRNVEEMLNFRDRVLEKFNSLVDIELSVLAARQLQKDCAVPSAQYLAGTNPADAKTQREENVCSEFSSRILILSTKG